MLDRQLWVIDEYGDTLRTADAAVAKDEKLVAEYGTRFTSTINAVSRKLTVKAMIAMNKAVAIDKRRPAAVARAFLRANGLA